MRKSARKEWKFNYLIHFFQKLSSNLKKNTNQCIFKTFVTIKLNSVGITDMRAAQKVVSCEDRSP